MRVALVSAHYPPNFVSGGTLVPQRIAGGLASRGHEVAVFAGRLDDGEPALTTTMADDRGIPVTWINITPYTAWDDIKNYDNPKVAAAFEQWIAEVNPDVVHFHSLQTFGGSLVSVAKAAGCRTVVTMHDFWWFCARQFLVDRDMGPCSLVVDAGICACQSGREELESRARTLAPHLAAADLVLAPSQITADVLRANGVPETKLRVNENGMERSVDPAGSPREARSDREPVRFRYTGGPDPMKGSGTLAEALALLSPSDDWRMTVHLPDRAEGPLAGLRTGGSVVRAEPYRPEELGAVLADTDVLVLPSLRETHSIMTREALLAGVPVITSDSLGPEEVVHSGENGIVVPTGDAPALAAAIESVVGDRAVLDRLRAGTGTCETRSIDQQVEEVEKLLLDLLDQAGPDDAGDWTPRQVAFIVGIDGAPLRYRAQFPAEALELVGTSTTILHYSDPRVDAAVEAADAVVVYRVPATPRILRIIERAKQRGVPVAFDVDDLIVDPDISDQIPGLTALAPDELALWNEGVQRYRTTLEHCDAYIGSTSTLVETVAATTGIEAYLKRNAYGLELARLSDAALGRDRDPGPVRIGYLSGTKTHDEDFRSVVPALCAVLDRFADVEVWLGGHLPSDPDLDRYGDRIVRLEFRPWTELPGLLRQLDVNLAPLSDLGTFNQAKSAIKWLEAALVATPTVARATVPFRDAITDGVDGVLVEDPDDWEDTIAALVADDVLRRSIGAAARRTALLRWSPHLEGQRYLDILRAVRAAGHRVPGAWSDVTVEEPASPGAVHLSAYPPDGGDPIVEAAVVAEPSLVGKISWSIRNESPRTVLRRAVRRIRRL